MVCRWKIWIGSLAVLPVALCAQGIPGVRQTGTVAGVTGNTLSVTTAGKTQMPVAVASDAVVLKLPPCGTNLKQATPATFADIASGDRVITGKTGDTATASRVILMKASDSAICRAKQQAEWQQHGTSGLVKGVDGTTLTIAVGAKTLTVNTSSSTIFRRYADDSVSFEDAKPGTLAQVQAGDQMSVRGAKSDDGSVITADEVVTGTFENLSGVLSGVDAAAGTVTLKDLTTKQIVTVKVTANSDVRKLPAQAGAMFANRGAASGGAAAGGAAAGGAGTARPRGAGMDLSRMLARFPAETVGELHTGDAVMVVASRGHGDSPTVITMLSGVEQLLSASSSGGTPITLSPWNISPEGAGSQ